MTDADWVEKLNDLIDGEYEYTTDWFESVAQDVSAIRAEGIEQGKAEQKARDVAAVGELVQKAREEFRPFQGGKPIVLPGTPEAILIKAIKAIEEDGT